MAGSVGWGLRAANEGNRGWICGLRWEHELRRAVVGTTAKPPEIQRTAFQAPVLYNRSKHAAGDLDRHVGVPRHTTADSKTVVGCLTAQVESEVAQGLKIFIPKGCSNCTDGYKGRVGIYQVLPVTETIAKIILALGSAVEIAEQAVKEGVWDLRRAGLEKVRQGLTSLEEVNSVTVE